MTAMAVPIERGLASGLGSGVGRACRTALLALAALCLLQFLLPAGDAAAQAVRPPADAAVLPESAPLPNAGGSVRPPAAAVSNAPMEPGIQRERDVVESMNPAKAATGLATQGPNSASTLWGEVRAGESHTVSIPNDLAGILIQSEGASWKNWRNPDGPLITWGLYSLAGILAVLVLFYLFRGRIRVEHGLSGITIERFKTIERMGHWLLAGSFILLALTGLNLLFGRDLIVLLFAPAEGVLVNGAPRTGLELLGPDGYTAALAVYAELTLYGKWVHNNVAWAFMLGLVMIFFMWVLHNFPHWTDIVWLAKGGGLFVKGVHPPARKFNAGQKMIFWGTILLGGSISLSGLSLLFPFELPMFAATFEKMNEWGISEMVLGATLATDLTPLEEMQYAQVWHTIVSLAMIVFIVAHIYIGSVGMEGAFDAMGSGQVDRNWALEHHGLWVAEEEAKARAAAARSAAATPAE
ncbi:MAG: cytochrome b/b6 domain-containing protein [Pseudomonadota bacterium]